MLVTRFKMDNSGRKLTLKAADLRAHPVTADEIARLRAKLEEVKQEPTNSAPPMIPVPRNLGEAKMMIEKFNEEFRRIDTGYRAKVDRLDAEL
jgi:hypothetical protein